jgi:hypothetical protein
MSARGQGKREDAITHGRHSLEVVKALGDWNDVFLRRDEFLGIGCRRKARHALADAPAGDLGAYSNNRSYRLKAGDVGELTLGLPGTIEEVVERHANGGNVYDHVLLARRGSGHLNNL